MEVYLSKGSDIYENFKRICSWYKGTKFKLIASDYSFVLKSYWSGGSRSTFRAFDMNINPIDVIVQGDPDQFYRGPAPTKWVPSTDRFLVEHVIFCGKDHGIHIHVHPDSIICQQAKMLAPPTEDVTMDQLFILAVTRGLKSFARRDEFRRAGFTDSEVEELKKVLVQKGLLNRAGAITPEGRNITETAYDGKGREQSFTWRYKKEGIINVGGAA